MTDRYTMSTKYVEEMQRDLTEAAQQLQQAIEKLQIPYPCTQAVLRGRATEALDMCQRALLTLEQRKLPF